MQFLSHNGYLYRKSSAFSFFTFKRYFSFMPLDNIVGNTQPQTRSLTYILGREKWLKNFTLILLGNSMTRIGYSNPNRAVFFPCFDFYFSLFFNSLNCINQKI